MRLTATALAIVSTVFFNGISVRAADFNIDKAHTSVSFFVTHLGYSRMLGQFMDFKGAFSFDPNKVDQSNVSMVIKTESVNTRHAARDKHLRSPDFFNAKEFPEMRFQSTKVAKTGEKTGTLIGDLTLLGVTKPVTLDVTFNSMRKHPLPQYKGVLTAGFSAQTKIKRSDFGMKYALGGIGDEISIVLEVEGAQKK